MTVIFIIILRNKLKIYLLFVYKTFNRHWHKINIMYIYTVQFEKVYSKYSLDI